VINDKSINQDNTGEYVEGIEDIKQCWRNIIFTAPGTIPFFPEFGCNYFKFIDLPITKSFAEAANIIIAALTRWEPRTTINKVTRTIVDSQVIINVFATYKSTGESIISEIDLSKIFVPRVEPIWILADTTWNDSGVWVDSDYWND